jgi:iodotyrosine deiodinase
MTRPRLVRAPKIDNHSDDEIIRCARKFCEAMQRRRTIRDFSDRPVPREVIEYCIRAAGTAPSGANLQPWHFVAISDPALKHEIRIAAEKEFYEQRAPKAWLEALAPLGTDSNKPFLEIAPWLIAVFAQPFRILADGTRSPTYYAIESAGIATGLLVTAVLYVRLGSTNAYPESDGIPESNSRTTAVRETICASCGRSSRGKRVGS